MEQILSKNVLRESPCCNKKFRVRLELYILGFLCHNFTTLPRVHQKAGNWKLLQESKNVKVEGVFWQIFAKMTWDSVEIGLAGGEETVTFGPRNETGSSLYQVDTLACVSPSEKVSCLFIMWPSKSVHFLSLDSNSICLHNASVEV